MLNAQPTQRHQGKLASGFVESGDVTYNYRLDPVTRARIKHGMFRYSVKAREDQYRFNHYINGAFHENLKDGEWSFRINQRDFQLQHPTKYTTGNISINAYYNNGIPHGEWRFESVLKHRDGVKQRDRWSWERHGEEQTVVVELNFNEGMLTGPFYAKVDQEFEVQGAFDENGFFDGEWIWRYSDSTITILWDHGVEASVKITDLEDNILHIEKHEHTVNLIKEVRNLVASNKTEKIADYPFTIDTLSMMQNKEYEITNLLHNTVYHPKYTLYNQIGGDKSVYYDRQRYVMRFNLKGMYVISTKNRISVSEAQHYSRISNLIRRMESQMFSIYKLHRDGKLKRQANDVVRLMEHNMNLARRYACIGEIMKIYPSADQGVEVSKQACSYLAAKIENLPAFARRENALVHFSHKIAEIEKDNNKHFKNIIRNMVE